MLIDQQWLFQPLGSSLSLVAAAGVSIPSLLTIDLLGSGVGTAPANIIGGTSTTVFGANFGVGEPRPHLQAVIGVQPVTGDACTLNMAWQFAVDSGASGNYQPGTWITAVETGAISAANLTVNTALRLEFPTNFPFATLPRYTRLLFQVPSGDYFTAGTISSALVTMGRDDLANKYAQRNYTV